MSIRYDAFYKCRLCDTKYESGETTGSKEIVINGMNCLALDIKPEIPMFPYMRMVHHCDDGGFGMADFCGFERVED